MKTETVGTRSRPKNFRADPYAYHEEITGLGSDGQGIGRRDGWVVMVPYALPDEVVRARVWRNRRSYSEADLVEVIPPLRIEWNPNARFLGPVGAANISISLTRNSCFGRGGRWRISSSAIRA